MLIWFGQCSWVTCGFVSPQRFVKSSSVQVLRVMFTCSFCSAASRVLHLGAPLLLRRLRFSPALGGCGNPRKFAVFMMAWCRAVSAFFASASAFLTAFAAPVLPPIASATVLPEHNALRANLGGENDTGLLTSDCVPFLFWIGQRPAGSGRIEAQIFAA